MLDRMLLTQTVGSSQSESLPPAGKQAQAYLLRRPLALDPLSTPAVKALERKLNPEGARWMPDPVAIAIPLRAMGTCPAGTVSRRDPMR